MRTQVEFMDYVLSMLDKRQHNCKYGTCNKCLVKKGLLPKRDPQRGLSFCNQCNRPLLHCACKGDQR